MLSRPVPVGSGLTIIDSLILCSELTAYPPANGRRAEGGGRRESVREASRPRSPRISLTRERAAAAEALTYRAAGMPSRSLPYWKKDVGYDNAQVPPPIPIQGDNSGIGY